MLKSVKISDITGNLFVQRHTVHHKLIDSFLCKLKFDHTLLPEAYSSEPDLLCRCVIFSPTY